MSKCLSVLFSFFFFPNPAPRDGVLACTAECSSSLCNSSFTLFLWLSCCHACVCVCVHLHCLLKVEPYLHGASVVKLESSSRAFINIFLLDLNSLQTENSPQPTRLPRHKQAQRKAPQLKAPAHYLELCCSQPALQKEPCSPRRGEAATLFCPTICSLFWPGDSQSAPSLEVIPQSNKARDCRGG